MPKSPDPLISKRILDIAEELLESGSESSVTLRRLSQKTGIAVTTIYERFHDRDGLLHALGQHIGEKLNKKLADVRSVEELFDQYLRLALTTPHRYKLLLETFASRLEERGTLPAIELLTNALAKQMGGSPDQYGERALGILQLAVGSSAAIRVSEHNREFQSKLQQSAKSALSLLLAPYPKCETREKASRNKSSTKSRK